MTGVDDRYRGRAVVQQRVGESHTGGAGADYNIISFDDTPRHGAASRTLNWPLIRVRSIEMLPTYNLT
jgi:hypothetical protein